VGDGMKRMLVFVLLFPLLCLLSFLMVAGLPDPSEYLSLVGAAYALMVGPAMLIAVVDRLLKQGWAVVACSLLGFLLASGVMYALLHGPNRFGLHETLFFGGIGAISAALCWLGARMMVRSERAWWRQT
jgi:hypothetical protein